MGVKQGKLSSIETGATELRAADLATAAMLGIDVLYVLTGERSEAAQLDPGAAALLEDYFAVPPREQKIARALVRTLRDANDPTRGEQARATLHGTQDHYRAGDSGSSG